MTGRDLLLFLRGLRASELRKEVRLDIKLGDSRPLLDIDDCDPSIIHLMAYVEPASEN